MVFVKNWEDFEIAAENMYMANPQNCRYTMKYVHSKGHILLKMTDNVKVRNIALQCEKISNLIVFAFSVCSTKRRTCPILRKSRKSQVTWSDTWRPRSNANNIQIGHGSSFRRNAETTTTTAEYYVDVVAVWADRRGSLTCNCLVCKRNGPYGGYSVW